MKAERAERKEGAGYWALCQSWSTEGLGWSTSWSTEGNDDVALLEE